MPSVVALNVAMPSVATPIDFPIGTLNHENFTTGRGSCRSRVLHRLLFDLRRLRQSPGKRLRERQHRYRLRSRQVWPGPNWQRLLHLRRVQQQDHRSQEVRHQDWQVVPVGDGRTNLLLRNNHVRAAQALWRHQGRTQCRNNRARRTWTNGTEARQSHGQHCDGRVDEQEEGGDRQRARRWQLRRFHRARIFRLGQAKFGPRPEHHFGPASGVNVIKLFIRRWCSDKHHAGLN